MLRNNTADAQAERCAHAAECQSQDTISSLQATDWNDEWKRLQRIRRKQDDAQYWNTRSKNFGTKDAPNPYVTEFIELAALRPGEQVMDMGCGTGSLAVPLALAGHPVLAADFSRGMLDEMNERVRATGAQGIEPVLISWDDDWNVQGVTPRCVDVAAQSPPATCAKRSQNSRPSPVEDAALRSRRAAAHAWTRTCSRPSA